jgi:rod shape-determining protein MreD
VNEESHGYWVILLSLLVAAVLAVLPLWRSLAWWRPEWLLLVLLYWTIALPYRVGTFTALAVGLLLDVLEGAPLGQNMLAMGVVITIAQLLHRRMRLFTLPQQALIVFFLAGLQQLIVQWLQNLQGAGADSFAFMLPAFSSALLWVPVLLLLRSVRRGYGVK